MEQIALTEGPSPVILELPPPAARASVFSFSLHKAGSTLLERVVMQLAAAARVPAINIPSTSFVQGTPEFRLTREVVGPILRREGYVFVGFRALSDFIPPEAIEGRRKVLLIRDPRDMLTSLYFSIAFSHVVPEAGEARDRVLARREMARNISIDEFILSAGIDEKVIHNYRQYMQIINADWVIYRYEDIIFNKRQWVHDLTRDLDLPVSRFAANRIANKNDVIPKTPNPQDHIRQVKPGNHREVLKPSTIKALDERFEDILDRFGYNAR